VTTDGTVIVDTATRLARCANPRIMSPVMVPVGGPYDGTFLPVEIGATYYGHGGDPERPGAMLAWVTSVHVLGRMQGARGGPVGDYRSLWYTTGPAGAGQPPAEWPDWVRAWAERHHPARGGVDNDPEGSYL